ncbi:MAG: MerR family transcriptional regulator, partial [Desulfobacterales bacterium]|nr:MerR family transcriptional regulator [Desulfobacterales bacterium]
MIKFYTNRELSQKLKINLARWKRWSREFLPPDPLGGIQSGYARQYSMDTAFTVYLGGYLVGELKYTIAEAKKILEELKSWLKEKDFYINI